MKHDLDKNEEVDIIKINDIEYKVWDIPPEIIRRILKVNTLFTSEEKLYEEWENIMEEILRIRNKEVNLKYVSKDKILAFAVYIQNKILKWNSSER